MRPIPVATITVFRDHKWTKPVKGLPSRIRDGRLSQLRSFTALSTQNQGRGCPLSAQEILIKDNCVDFIGEDFGSVFDDDNFGSAFEIENDHFASIFDNEDCWITTTSGASWIMTASS